MAGEFNISITVTGQEQILVGFSRLAEDIQDWSEVFQDIGADFHEMEARQFDSEGGYGGTPWAPLSKNYAAWKARNFPGNQILVLSGQLKESLIEGDADIIEAMHAFYGTRLPVASFHQFGTSRMPARPVVFMTDEDLTRWTKLVQLWLVRKANKAFAGLMPSIGAGESAIKSIQQE